MIDISSNIDLTISKWTLHFMVRVPLIMLLILLEKGPDRVRGLSASGQYIQYQNLLSNPYRYVSYYSYYSYYYSYYYYSITNLSLLSLFVLSLFVLSLFVLSLFVLSLFVFVLYMYLCYIWICICPGGLKGPHLGARRAPIGWPKATSPPQELEVWPL